jgi:8-hydroxy-5-deazaflavin:NADPH oxidoreductase
MRLVPCSGHRGAPLRVAVIGGGNVGRAVGKAWIRSGHHVVYGVPDPQHPKYAAIGARAQRPVQAASDVEFVLLATPWQVTEAVCRDLGGLPGKIVLDCTNPLKLGAEGLELAVGFSQSGGELVQSWCASASVFKTLNQAGFEIMGHASRVSGHPVMFVAGDNAAAKPAVLNLVRDLGFEAIDAGPLKIARLLEPYGALWINLALKRGLGRHFAFSLVPFQPQPSSAG